MHESFHVSAENTYYRLHIERIISYYLPHTKNYFFFVPMFIFFVPMNSLNEHRELIKLKPPKINGFRQKFISFTVLHIKTRL